MPISLASTSITMLNKRGEAGHPCLVPDIRKKSLIFSPLSITVGFPWMLLNILKKILFLVCGEVFKKNYECVLNLVRWPYSFSFFSFLIWLIALIEF